VLDGPPDRQRPGLTRTWGDGATDRRGHVIVDVSYGEGWVRCRCGHMVVAGTVGLDQAWDAHRGVLAVAHREVSYAFETQASDAEVASFLHRIDQRKDRAPSLTESDCQSAAPEPLAYEDAVTVSALLEQLEDWQARCTCKTQPVELCPNYQPGDEKT
jgi:hypothetical protein